MYLKFTSWSIDWNSSNNLLGRVTLSMRSTSRRQEFYLLPLSRQDLTTTQQGTTTLRGRQRGSATVRPDGEVL